MATCRVFSAMERRVFVMSGERVPVGDEEVAIVFLLELQPVGEGAEEMAEVQAAGGPHSAEDSFRFSQD